MINKSLVLLVGLSLMAGLGMGTAASQDEGEVIVSIYHVAPGRHADFLKWMAAREAVAREAGAGDTQWYVHHNGDAWDYVGISPSTSAEQDRKIDELSEKRGLTTGMRAGLELRQLISSHTDTFAGGPYTAAELLKLATQ